MKLKYLVLGILLSVVTCISVCIPIKIKYLKKERNRCKSSFNVLKSDWNDSIEELKLQLNTLSEANSEEIEKIKFKLNHIKEKVTDELDSIKSKVFFKIIGNKEDRGVLVKRYIWDKKFREIVKNLKEIYDNIDVEKLLYLKSELGRELEEIQINIKELQDMFVRRK